MRHFIVVALIGGIAGALFAGWRWCGVETVVVLARHADRAAGHGADELAATGVARSQELARALHRAGVSAIIRSDTHRAAQTTAPLAAATGLAPIVLPPKDFAAIAREVRRHPGETVVVIGHSNTVPAIIAALGGPQLADIGEAEFDDLFVLTVCRCNGRSARLLHLQYGALSPVP